MENSSSGVAKGTVRLDLSSPSETESPLLDDFSLKGFSSGTDLYGKEAHRWINEFYWEVFTGKSKQERDELAELWEKIGSLPSSQRGPARWYLLFKLSQACLFSPLRSS